MNFLKLFEKPDLVAAHRGDRSRQPENTLSALRSSIGKCDFIEIDVQLSRDRMPVIMHDETLGRTSNAKERFRDRKPWHVNDFSFEELQSLDYGSWFNGRSEPLLTLQQALAFAIEENQYLNIEIKDMSAFADDAEVVQTVITAIEKYGAESLVLLSSFYHPYLQLSKTISPVIPTAALLEHKKKDLLNYLRSLNVNACHLDDVITDRHTVHALRASGFAVNVYTVNDPVRQKELFAWGVNGVFTDNL
ncbi:glycerophosphodiester phosphodiesterase family protein [Sulfurimonas sp. HSL3-7]|uniref:glycerophosphodiester phosphodiesterase n=1 Tax=Sulfonitrofixus jiaomeiensis TaxID=3131938 RepID=UPI0031F97A2A